MSTMSTSLMSTRGGISHKNSKSNQSPAPGQPRQSHRHQSLTSVPTKFSKRKQSPLADCSNDSPQPTTAPGSPVSHGKELAKRLKSLVGENLGQPASIGATQNVEETILVGEVSLKPPDSVWAKFDTNPWWPCYLAIDPDTNEWKRGSGSKLVVRVIFYGDESEAWLAISKIKRCLSLKTSSGTRMTTLLTLKSKRCATQGCAKRSQTSGDQIFSRPLAPLPSLPPSPLLLQYRCSNTNIL
jgi:hypothetical protein